MGHSNAVFIEAESSVILIDTLDTMERGKRLLDIIKRETKKEVRTILYTHGHPDHRGGAGAFMGSAPEIIAFAPKTPPLARTQMLRDIQNLRGARHLCTGILQEFVLLKHAMPSARARFHDDLHHVVLLLHQ